MRFLVVEVTSAESPVTRLSRASPKTALDFFLKVPPLGGTEPVAAVCQVRGGSPADREALFEAIRQVDPEARRMRSPPGVLRANARFPWDRTPPEMKAVSRFAATHGIWAVWCLVTDGVIFLRLMAEGHPATLADALAESLKAAGVEAQVELEEDDDAETSKLLGELTLMLEEFRQAPPGGRA